MRIEPDDDPRYRRVTFTWSDPDPGHRAQDVLLRLHTMTDKARVNRDLGRFLMRRETGDPADATEATEATGDWTLTLRLRADFRAAYQFCPSPAPLSGRTFPETKRTSGWS